VQDVGDLRLIPQFPGAGQTLLQQRCRAGIVLPLQGCAAQALDRGGDAPLVILCAEQGQALLQQRRRSRKINLKVGELSQAKERPGDLFLIP
jgi:hypothetical protein